MALSSFSTSGCAAVASSNSILLHRLAEWLPATSSKGIEERVHEWGDTEYLLQRSPEGGISLSLFMPGMDDEGMAASCSAAYKGIAKLAVVPHPGYQLTLELNVRMLSKLPTAQQKFWLKEIASLRLTLMSTPLRRHFQLLVRDGCLAGPAEAHCSGSKRVYFIKPEDGAVTVIFPIQFMGAQDLAVGKAFLLEFVEARKLAALSKSPECRYEQSTPRSLECVEPDLLSGVNGGFMTFTFTKRHVHGPHVSCVVWSMCSFYFMLSCHLTACKAKMQLMMRSRLHKLVDAVGEGGQKLPLEAGAAPR